MTEFRTNAPPLSASKDDLVLFSYTRWFAVNLTLCHAKESWKKEAQFNFLRNTLYCVGGYCKQYNWGQFLVNCVIPLKSKPSPYPTESCLFTSYLSKLGEIRSWNVYLLNQILFLIPKCSKLVICQFFFILNNDIILFWCVKLRNFVLHLINFIVQMRK